MEPSMTGPSGLKGSLVSTHSKPSFATCKCHFSPANNQATSIQLAQQLSSHLQSTHHPATPHSSSQSPASSCLFHLPPSNQHPTPSLPGVGMSDLSGMVRGWVLIIGRRGGGARNGPRMTPLGSLERENRSEDPNLGIRRSTVPIYSQ